MKIIRSSLSITSFIIGLSILSPFTLEVISWPLILICLFVFGIPHGAIDHLLYYKVFNAQRPNSVGKSTVYFYSNYLTILFMWVILWDADAFLAFWSFLLMSSYHFGEQDLDYITGLDPLIAQAAFVSRGALVVFLSFSQQPNVSLPIVQKLIPIDEKTFMDLCEKIYYWNLVQHFVCLALLGVILKLNLLSTGPKDKFLFPPESAQISLPVLSLEVLKAVMIVLLFHQTGPLIGFAIFFAFWHSMDTIWSSIKALKPKQEDPVTPFDILQFYKLTLPYALISYAGFAMLYVFGNSVDISTIDRTLVWAVFIGGVSVLTGPHMWVISCLHQKTNLDPLGFGFLVDFENSWKQFTFPTLKIADIKTE